MIRHPWTVRIDIGDEFSATIQRDDPLDLAAPVVVGDGLEYSWSFVDDRAVGHLEPAVLKFTLLGFDVESLPDVQTGAPVRFLFTHDLTAARHIVYFRGRITDVDLTFAIPGRRRRKAELALTAVDDLATLADATTTDRPPVKGAPRTTTSPATSLPGVPHTLTPAAWRAARFGVLALQSTTDNALERGRRRGAGVLQGRRPHTVVSSSMLSGGREVVPALPDTEGAMDVWADDLSWYEPIPAGGPIPAAIDTSQAPAAYFAPVRVRLDGTEPALLHLTLDQGVVGVVEALPADPGYTARTVLSGDAVIAPAAARRDRTHIYNQAVYQASPELDSEDDLFFEVTATAADALTYGRIQHVVSTEAAVSTAYPQATADEVAAAYLPDVDAIRGEWALDDIVVRPDFSDTAAGWLAAARLAMPANVAGQIGREVILADLEDAPTRLPFVVGVQLRSKLVFEGGEPIIETAAQPGPFKPADAWGAHLVSAADLVGTPFDLPATAFGPDITPSILRYVAKP